MSCRSSPARQGPGRTPAQVAGRQQQLASGSDVPDPSVPFGTADESATVCIAFMHTSVRLLTESPTNSTPGTYVSAAGSCYSCPGRYCLHQKNPGRDAPPSASPQAPTLVRQDLTTLVFDTSSLVPRLATFPALLKGGTSRLTRGASTLATDPCSDRPDADPDCRGMPLPRIAMALRL